MILATIGSGGMRAGLVAAGSTAAPPSWLGLAEVANMVGFSTQSHFTAIFDRLCGTMPKRFRDSFGP